MGLANDATAADDLYVKDGRVVIRSSVDMVYGTDTIYYSVDAAEWYGMTEDEQTKLCADIAVEHQNNVAGCGASLVSWSEATDQEVTPYD
jgi:hypothetical protein